MIVGWIVVRNGGLFGDGVGRYDELYSSMNRLVLLSVMVMLVGVVFLR